MKKVNTFLQRINVFICEKFVKNLPLRVTYLANKIAFVRLMNCNGLTFYLQMQKSKHKRNKNKRPTAIARSAEERKLQPKNERYTGRLYFSEVSVLLDYGEVRDRIGWHLS